MQTDSVSLTSATTSRPIITGTTPSSPKYFGVGFGLIFTAATATAKVQHTFDDPTSGSAVWFDHPTATGKSANWDDNYAFPVRGIRLNVTAYTSGTVTLTACIA